MALDLQTNWNVEMSKPPAASSRSSDARKSDPELKHAMHNDSWCTPPSRPLALPLELLAQVLQYLPKQSATQQTLWACSLTSRDWYNASVQSLYTSPYLVGSNFDAFVRTICPSKNMHITHSALAGLVRTLDMGKLVHESTRSTTARLLGRLKGNLESFVAPQSSFAINCYAALGKCSRIRHVDLSLLSSNISTELLLKTLKSLSYLETLVFPRCSATSLSKADFSIWSCFLKTIHLSSSIGASLLRDQPLSLPASLESLSLQHCPFISRSGFEAALHKCGRQLRHFSFRYPNGDADRAILNNIFTECPNLLSLAMSADYFTSTIWDNIALNHPLRTLVIDVSPMAEFEALVNPADIYIAIEEARLSDLRQIRFSSRFNWIGGTDRQYKDCMSLVEILEVNEMERPMGIETGLWPLES